jgi:hypothetical protein
MLSKVWVWDPRSGIRNKPIPDPGVKRHRIPDPDPQHWLLPVTCVTALAYIPACAGITAIAGVPI